MKWLADENFDNDILRGIIRRLPEFDVVRAQDLRSRGGRSGRARMGNSQSPDSANP